MSSLNISVNVSADCESAVLNVNNARYPLCPGSLQSKADVRSLLRAEPKFVQDACLGLLEDMANTMKTRLCIECDITRNAFAIDVRFVINNRAYFNDVDDILGTLSNFDLPKYVQSAAMSLLHESM